MANNINEVVELLRYIKSVNGEYLGFTQYTKSHDIHTISICCLNIFKEDIPIAI